MRLSAKRPNPGRGELRHDVTLAVYAGLAKDGREKPVAKVAAGGPSRSRGGRALRPQGRQAVREAESGQGARGSARALPSRAESLRAAAMERVQAILYG